MRSALAKALSTGYRLNGCFYCNALSRRQLQFFMTNLAIAAQCLPL